eukprot:3326652-Rhodomonas_salina.6
MQAAKPFRASICSHKPSAGHAAMHADLTRRIVCCARECVRARQSDVALQERAGDRCAGQYPTTQTCGARSDPLVMVWRQRGGSGVKTERGMVS